MNQSDIDANESVSHRSSGPLPMVHLRCYGLAVLFVGVALTASLLLEHLHFRVPSALLLLFAVAITSWYAGLGPAILAALLSIISFYYYFVEPVRTVYIYRSQIPYFIVFTAFAALLSWFGAVRRRVEADLRRSRDALQEQASLLSLTHDAVYVRDMTGVIRYWNRGAELLYGWQSEQALGTISHELLKAVLPAPLEEIEAELLRTGRWEGELAKSRQDGTSLIVATRWSLQRDDQGDPVAVLVTSNDITESKRSEEALRRLNRELRAISDCNQALLRATDELSLLKQICRIVCDEAGYRMAWVGYAEHDDAKRVRPVAWTGAGEAYLASAGLTWADTERGRGPTGTAIRSGNTCCVQDFATDPRLEPWRESALQHGYRSGIALPLKDEQANVFGSLTIRSAQPNAFTPEEIRLLEELAGDLAFGIVTLRSAAARKRAEAEVTLLSFALNNVREAALLIDETARFHYVNDEACRVLGYTRAELLAMTVPDIDPEFPGERWSEHWRELKAQRSLSFESRHRTKDGRIFPVEVSANYFEYGGRAYNLRLVRDISERKRAEEALRRSEVYLAEGQRLSHTGSWAWSAVTRQSLYWSEEMCRIFGFDPQEGVPDTEIFWQRIHPEDFDATYELLMKAATESMEYEHEHRIVLPDGTVKHIHAIGHPVLDEKGQVAKYVGTAMDITERKRAEEELRESESRFRTFVDHAGDAFFVYDLENRTVIDVNRQACESMGYTRQELIGKTPDAFHPESNHAEIESVVERAAAGETVFDTHWHRRKDGSTFPVEVHTTLVSYGGQRFQLTVARDITDRLRAEEAIRQSEKQLRDVIEGIPAIAIAIRLDGAVEFINKRAQEYTGMSAEEGLGSGWQNAFHPKDIGRYLEKRRAALASGDPFEDEVRIRCAATGEYRWFLSRAVPLRDERGAIVRWYAVATDIEDRKRAEERLQHENVVLREEIDKASMFEEVVGASPALQVVLSAV